MRASTSFFLPTLTIFGLDAVGIELNRHRQRAHSRIELHAAAIDDRDFAALDLPDSGAIPYMSSICTLPFCTILFAMPI
jgi:hypothetical protein